MSEDGDELVRKMVFHSLAESRLGNTEDYLRRGRYLQSFSDERLDEDYCEAMEEWSDDVLNPKNRLLVNDIESECGLRHREPPYEKVKEYINKIGEAVAKYAENNLTDEIKKEINDDIVGGWEAANKYRS